MKLKTSFFNITVLKKDILRFSPVWAAYTIILLLYLFNLSDMGTTALRAINVTESMTGIVWVNFIYAGICAIFLFMDLFNPRLCNAQHAFPIRREGWLITHCIAGFLFSLIPNLLVSILGGIMLREYAYVAFLWLAVAMLQYLFFFCTAVLSAVCAGNLLGFAAIYGIIHFVAVLIYGVAGLLYQPLLYGFQFERQLFYLFFPLGQMNGADYVRTSYLVEGNSRLFEVLGLVESSWLYLSICVAVGVLSLILAWQVYRKRNLETAGNFISLKPLSPIFLLICAIGAGAFLYLICESMGEKSYVFLMIGVIIGYVAGSMLLNRTLRVFGRKSMLGMGILIVVLTASLGLTRLDPVGVTTYIPDIDSIESAAVIGADNKFYYADPYGISYNNMFTDSHKERVFRMTDRDELILLQDFHEQLIQTRPGNDDGVLCDVVIDYTLKNGRTITRYYKVARNSDLGDRAGAYFSDMRYLFSIDDLSTLYHIFESVSIDDYADDKITTVKLTDREEISGLLDAIKADCEAGTTAQNWAYHTKYEENYYVAFSIDDSYTNNENIMKVDTRFDIWTNCVNTTKYLQDIIELHKEG